MAGEDDTDLPLAAEVLDRLRRRGQTLAVAESLTGGLLAATLVAVSGASTVFRGGLVTYATELKHELAEVPAGLLAERGPVDPQVALAMADGARRRCGADWGVATTGVAGPNPQHGIPVGTVYLACVGPHLAGEVRPRRFTGDRQQIRRASVRAALMLLRDQA
ncbi:MAG TPA: CinA family protein [Natronosporangium sp.]|nr:CinA family protein [Natronosporangium sp.]